MEELLNESLNGLLPGAFNFRTIIRSDYDCLNLFYSTFPSFQRKIIKSVDYAINVLNTTNEPFEIWQASLKQLPVFGLLGWFNEFGLNKTNEVENEISFKDEEFNLVFVLNKIFFPEDEYVTLKDISTFLVHKDKLYELPCINNSEYWIVSEIKPFKKKFLPRVTMILSSSCELSEKILNEIKQYIIKLDLPEAYKDLKQDFSFIKKTEFVYKTLKKNNTIYKIQHPNDKLDLVFRQEHFKSYLNYNLQTVKNSFTPDIINVLGIFPNYDISKTFVDGKIPNKWDMRKKTDEQYLKTLETFLDKKNKNNPFKEIGNQYLNKENKQTLKYLLKEFNINLKPPSDSTGSSDYDNTENNKHLMLELRCEMFYKNYYNLIDSLIDNYEIFVLKKIKELNINLFKDEEKKTWIIELKKKDDLDEKFFQFILNVYLKKINEIEIIVLNQSIFRFKEEINLNDTNFIEEYKNKISFFLKRIKSKLIKIIL